MPLHLDDEHPGRLGQPLHHAFRDQRLRRPPAPHEPRHHRRRAAGLNCWKHKLKLDGDGRVSHPALRNELVAAITDLRTSYSRRFYKVSIRPQKSSFVRIFSGEIEQIHFGSMR